jgi:hypothetical protein
MRAEHGAGWRVCLQQVGQPVVLRAQPSEKGGWLLLLLVGAQWLPGSCDATHLLLR